jgi:hypothetical protein
MMATPVIFRKWPKSEGGDIIALFPTEPGTNDPYDCSSYEHVGQHGSADPNGLISRTKAATPEEYADLKKELKQIGYKDLVVYQRLQNDWVDVRRAKIKGTYVEPKKRRKHVVKKATRRRQLYPPATSLRGVR